MRWSRQLKSGQYYELLQKGFFEKKPEELEPDVEGLEFYLDAFRELSTSRPVGLEVGAIPFTAISEYFKIYQLQDVTDFDEFAYIIRALDRAYLEENERATKAERAKDKGGKGGGNNRNAADSNKG